MTDAVLLALDALAVLTLAGLIAGVAWLLLTTVREARCLDDPWLDSPGGRNDRAQLLDGSGPYVLGNTRRPR